MGQDPEAIRSEIEQTRERMGDTVDALGYKTDVKSRAKDSVNDRVDSIKGAFTGSTPSTGDVKDAAQRGKGVAQDNPLGLAIGAAGVGFLAGMLIPASRVENEKLGPMADTVKDQVKETAHVALEHGKDAAQEATQAAAEAVKETGSEHAEQAKGDLQEQAAAARNELQKAAPTGWPSTAAGSLRPGGGSQSFSLVRHSKQWLGAGTPRRAPHQPAARRRQTGLRRRGHRTPVEPPGQLRSKRQCQPA